MISLDIRAYYACLKPIFSEVAVVYVEGVVGAVTQEIFDDENLESMYQRVVVCPNESSMKSLFIKCPVCGEEILMIPTLRAMNGAIENHVFRHKKVLKDDQIKGHQVAISIRLSLTMQVLSYACKTELG